jgi:hypothetical protein
MREDMYKVIVERPRHYKRDDSQATRRRNDLDGPTQLGMRAGYGRPVLNENLSPLRRFLRAQVGRPWNKVHGEIASCIDRRNTVQQHIYQHLDDFIATRVEVRDGRIIDLRLRYAFRRDDAAIRQELHVDPRTGLIRRNKAYQSWRQASAARRTAELAEIDARRRVLDERRQLHLLRGEWFEVLLEPLPEERVLERNVNGRLIRKRVAEPRFDIVLKRSTSRVQHGDADERAALYGSMTLYAAAKRQLSRREKGAHGLL